MYRLTHESCITGPTPNPTLHNNSNFHKNMFIVNCTLCFEESYCLEEKSDLKSDEHRGGFMIIFLTQIHWTQVFEVIPDVSNAIQ